MPPTPDPGPLPPQPTLPPFPQCGKMALALEVFNAMRAEGCTPNVVTYNTLIDVHGKLGQWDAAIGVIKLMRAEVRLWLCPGVRGLRRERLAEERRAAPPGAPGAAAAPPLPGLLGSPRGHAVSTPC
jgi:pentatricopeptide repeat protein